MNIEKRLDIEREIFLYQQNAQENGSYTRGEERYEIQKETG